MLLKSFLIAGLLLAAAITPGRAHNTSDTARAVNLLGARFHKGFVLIHSRDLVPVRHSNPSGLEIDWAWHKVSRKAWQSCHCYPKVGAALSLWDYDQPDILGYGATGMFYLEPVFGAWRKVSFSIRAAFGLSYQTRPYDAVANPYNQSYSTYVAFPLQLGANMHIRLRPQWYLDLTGVYNHFSNGGIREPNKGINWPTASVGFTRYLKQPVFEPLEKTGWREEKAAETRFDIAYFSAFNEPASKLFLLSPGLELKFSRRFSRLSALTAGAEWMYDNGARFEMERAGRKESPQKAGMAIGHEFLLGKFIFSQQFGAYLYRPYRVGDDVYQRYNLVFRASRRIFLGAGLKAHRHVADFLDIRAGISL